MVIKTFNDQIMSQVNNNLSTSAQYQIINNYLIMTQSKQFGNKLINTKIYIYIIKNININFIKIKIFIK